MSLLIEASAAINKETTNTISGIISPITSIHNNNGMDDHNNSNVNDNVNKMIIMLVNNATTTTSPPPPATITTTTKSTTSSTTTDSSSSSSDNSSPSSSLSSTDDEEHPFINLPQQQQEQEDQQLQEIRKHEIIVPEPQQETQQDQEVPSTTTTIISNNNNIIMKLSNDEDTKNNHNEEDHNQNTVERKVIIVKEQHPSLLLSAASGLTFKGQQQQPTSPPSNTQQEQQQNGEHNNTIVTSTISPLTNTNNYNDDDDEETKKFKQIIAASSESTPTVRYIKKSSTTRLHHNNATPASKAAMAPRYSSSTMRTSRYSSSSLLPPILLHRSSSSNDSTRRRTITDHHRLNSSSSSRINIGSPKTKTTRSAMRHSFTGGMTNNNLRHHYQTNSPIHHIVNEYDYIDQDHQENNDDDYNRSISFIPPIIQRSSSCGYQLDQIASSSLANNTIRSNHDSYNGGVATKRTCPTTHQVEASSSSVSGTDNHHEGNYHPDESPHHSSPHNDSTNVNNELMERVGDLESKLATLSQLLILQQQQQQQHTTYPNVDDHDHYIEQFARTNDNNNHNNKVSHRMLSDSRYFDPIIQQIDNDDDEYDMQSRQYSSSDDEVNHRYHNTSETHHGGPKQQQQQQKSKHNHNLSLMLLYEGDEEEYERNRNNEGMMLASMTIAERRWLAPQILNVMQQNRSNGIETNHMSTPSPHNHYASHNSRRTSNNSSNSRRTDHRNNAASTTPTISDDEEDNMSENDEHDEQVHNNNTRLLLEAVHERSRRLSEEAAAEKQQPQEVIVHQPTRSEQNNYDHQMQLQLHRPTSIQDVSLTSNRTSHTNLLSLFQNPNEVEATKRDTSQHNQIPSVNDTNDENRPQELLQQQIKPNPTCESLHQDSRDTGKNNESDIAFYDSYQMKTDTTVINADISVLKQTDQQIKFEESLPPSMAFATSMTSTDAPSPQDNNNCDDDLVRSKWLEYLNSFQEPTQDIERQMEEFVKVPGCVEQIMTFGVFICIDSFLYMCTILPIRFVWNCFLLIIRLIQFTLHHMTSIFRRHRKVLIYHKYPYLQFHRQHLYQIIQVIITYTVYRFILCPISIGKLYHWIRGQSMIKLYVIIAMVELFDRLFSVLGQDFLDSMYWNTVSRPGSKRFFISVLVALIYVSLHTMILFVHVATLNVAMNSSDQALLTLLISGNFAEIKSTVLKKYNKAALFKITAGDICERFKLALFLSLILLLNICQGMNQKQLIEYLKVCSFVWIAEIFADWIKHSFITKFNFLSSTVYPEYGLILAGDVTGFGHENINLDHSHAVVKRIGFAQIPLIVVMLRFLKEAFKYASIHSLFIQNYLLYINQIKNYNIQYHHNNNDDISISSSWLSLSSSSSLLASLSMFIIRCVSSIQSFVYYKMPIYIVTEGGLYIMIWFILLLIKLILGHILQYISHNKLLNTPALQQHLDSNNNIINNTHHHNYYSSPTHKKSKNTKIIISKTPTS